MTIGVDIRSLASTQRSGVQEYAIEILSRLVSLGSEHKFKFFFTSSRLEPPKFHWLSAPNSKLYHFRIPNDVLSFASRLSNQPKLDKLINGADVFFSPHFFIAPLSPNCRRVTTFHDLSYLRFPEFFTIRQRFWHALMNPQRTARFSDAIISVSESTKSDLVNYYGVDPAKIHTIYSGSSLSRPAPEKLEEFKKKHNLPDRYIFSLATLEPRKNIIGVIRAFNILKENPDFHDLKLIIGGASGWLYSETISEIEKSPYRADIRYVGYVENDRSYFYALASVFVYPSFFEGFGFPVLEAMACQIPVVTSHNSSLPEVAGEAAILVDPYNISDIASAIGQILTNRALGARLVEKGAIRADQFQWDNCAAKTLELITSVAL